MHITYINTNNITIVVQQLHVILTIQCKGENTPHHDNHHIQHPLIIHTSLFIHNKPFMKEFQNKRVQ